MKARSLCLLLISCLAATPALARPMVGLTDNNILLFFDSATPGTIGSSLAINGLAAGDSVHAIDFRPSNGIFYLLAINTTAATNTGRIYTLNPATGIAIPIGATPFTTTSNDGALYGFDFDP